MWLGERWVKINNIHDTNKTQKEGPVLNSEPIELVISGAYQARFHER